MWIVRLSLPVLRGPPGEFNEKRAAYLKMVSLGYNTLLSISPICHPHQTISEYQSLYSFPKVTLIKYHKLCGLTNRNLLSHSSGGQKSKNMVLVGLMATEV